jgi:hypothetical protein
MEALGLIQDFIPACRSLGTATSAVVLIRERDVGKFVRGVGAELRRPADRPIREESTLLRALREPVRFLAALGEPGSRYAKLLM